VLSVFNSRKPEVMSCVAQMAEIEGFGESGLPIRIGLAVVCRTTKMRSTLMTQIESSRCYREVGPGDDCPNRSPMPSGERCAAAARERVAVLESPNSFAAGLLVAARNGIEPHASSQPRRRSFDACSWIETLPSLASYITRSTRVAIRRGNVASKRGSVATFNLPA
jgi:hypothetical protein